MLVFCRWVCSYFAMAIEAVPNWNSSPAASAGPSSTSDATSPAPSPQPTQPGPDDDDDDGSINNTGQPAGWVNVPYPRFGPLPTTGFDHAPPQAPTTKAVGPQEAPQPTAQSELNEGISQENPPRSAARRRTAAPIADDAALSPAQPIVSKFASYADEPYQKRPYSQDTLDRVRQMAPLIKKFSEQYNVPPLAVAGSIAEEFDTGKADFGLKGVWDRFQDRAAQTRLDGPLRNMFSKRIGWDLGAGNIRPSTAKALITSAPDEFPNVDPNSQNGIDAFTATDSGNAQLAAKYISWAEQDLDRLFSQTKVPLYDDYRIALYVDYYRKGADTMWHGKDGRSGIMTKTIDTPIPYEQLPTAYYGARVIANKQKILDALSLDPSSGGGL